MEPTAGEDEAVGHVQQHSPGKRHTGEEHERAPEPEKGFVGGSHGATHTTPALGSPTRVITARDRSGRPGETGRAASAWGARRRPRSTFEWPGSPCEPVRPEEGERHPRALRACAAEAPSRRAARARRRIDRAEAGAREQSHEACRRVRRHVRPAVDDVRIVAMDRKRVETRHPDEHIPPTRHAPASRRSSPSGFVRCSSTWLTMTRSNIGSSGTACSRRCR